jgi:glycosyltransferase involved in cell wall biosynthesis
LCDAIASCKWKVLLVTQRTSTEQNSNLVLPCNPSVELYSIKAFRKLRITYSPGYRNRLSKIVENSQISIMHNHGLWLQCNHQSSNVAHCSGVPYIISPHGMLEPWAFANNAWKKKIVWFAWQLKALQCAKAFCATSDQEAESIRLLGFKQPVAVIPNGIDFPAYFEKHDQSKSTIRYALFLSRVHKKKGLLNLVKAWSIVAPRDWKLIIAGPDEAGYQQVVQDEINSLGLNSVIFFVGHVDGVERERLYREASLFVLPTFSENFGVVVAEALAVGTPVITTKGAPWEGLITHNCGWWVDIGVEPLVEAIREATSLSDAERISMGWRGRKYVMNEFGWDEVGRKTVSFYDWILRGGSPPEFVRLD